MQKELTRLIIGLSFVFSLLSITSCNDDNEVSTAPMVSFYVPDGFPQPAYSFKNNAFTPLRFELGKKLFYDPILSRDSTISCGSCHQQFAAFAHLDHFVSHGIDDLLGTRNAPPLFNLAWHSEFMWDGGVINLESQPFAPITNPVEMDETIANAVMKLRRSSFYPSLFRTAYGSDSITSQMMARAITLFMVGLISADSKYDRYKKRTATFTDSEERGYALFKAKCESCHQEPLLTDLKYRNNGLDARFLDAGRAVISTLPQDSGKFKVPSLRNVALSYPYMHDGRFRTLSSVIDHYRSGIKQSSTLDPLLINGNMSITDAEKADILSFLNTLTDQTFITNKKFGEM
jgi:cytochrome c peroxidase